MRQCEFHFDLKRIFAARLVDGNLMINSDRYLHEGSKVCLRLYRVQWRIGLLPLTHLKCFSFLIQINVKLFVYIVCLNIMQNYFSTNLNRISMQVETLVNIAIRNE